MRLTGRIVILLGVLLLVAGAMLALGQPPGTTAVEGRHVVTPLRQDLDGGGQSITNLGGITATGVVDLAGAAAEIVLRRTIGGTNVVEITGAGSSAVNGIYVWDGADRFGHVDSDYFIAFEDSQQEWSIYPPGGGPGQILYYESGEGFPVEWTVLQGEEPAPGGAWSEHVYETTIAPDEIKTPHLEVTPGSGILLGGQRVRSWEQAMQAATAEWYPVFHIPLGDAWTDFEIKASIDNFASTNHVYYYKSFSAAQDVTRGDTNAWVYFTDDHSADVREWRSKPLDQSVSSQLVSTNSVVPQVVFLPSRDTAVPADDWMSSTNKNLVWSFVRVDDIGYEQNASATKQRWSPVMPVEWRAERIEP